MATCPPMNLLRAFTPPAPGRPAWLTLHRPLADALHIGLPGVIELLGGRAHAVLPDAVLPEAVLPDADQRFVVRRVERGSSLVYEGAAADALYVVQSGSFKRVKTAEDGYEHVLGFAWRRDLIGYDGLAAGRYAFSAVAMEDSRVVALPVASFDSLRHRVEALDAALQGLIARQLAHAGEIAEVMAAVAADVRLARFLVRLSACMAERGESPRRLRLRMNRRDIANHLGLAHETISRSFRVLAEGGWLRVDNREVEIVDLDGLKRCARSTRGTIDEAPARPRLAQPVAA